MPQLENKKKRSLNPNMFMARLAEQADRFPDMLAFLEKVVEERKDNPHFTHDERNLMSHAFKNLITPKRQTWRNLVQQLDANVENYSESQLLAVKQYTQSIEDRLHDLCLGIVQLVQE